MELMLTLNGVIVTAGYSDFVIELKQKLSENSLGMTAAFLFRN